MKNFYESCIPCNDCQLPFLPKDNEENICPECTEINTHGYRTREEKEGANQSKAD